MHIIVNSNKKHFLIVQLQMNGRLFTFGYGLPGCVQLYTAWLYSLYTGKLIFFEEKTPNGESFKSCFSLFCILNDIKID